MKLFNFLFRWRRHNKIAREIAEKRGMLKEYEIARGHGCSPIEALEEWDLITPDEYSLFD